MRIFDYVVSRADVDANRIVIMGRSLGSVMAVHVAARRSSRAVVLVSPLDSMVDLGRRHHPYLPVLLLLRHRFEAIADAPGARMPLLAVVSTLEGIVPVEHSRRLIGACAGPSTWREISGADHSNISDSPGYWNAIAEFLVQMRGLLKTAAVEVMYILKSLDVPARTSGSRIALSASAAAAPPRLRFWSDAGGISERY